MWYFLLEHVLRENLQSSESLYPRTWVVTEVMFHFSLEKRTICSTKRTLRTWRILFLLLTTVWFYQMSISKWILQIGRCHFPPAPIPKRFPGGAHGCCPCTTQLQRTCCQVCVQLPSSSRSRCKQLLMMLCVPVWHTKEIFWRERETSDHLAVLYQKGLYLKTTLAWAGLK